MGDETWSALVDATFRLGDRLLYLKIPYLHGADVRELQGALNILGFACGQPDGIFGTFTERAVGEFQANVGLPTDGIAGLETVRAIDHLKHVWQGKDPSAPIALRVAPARAAEVLRGVMIRIIAADEASRIVAERIANLALATDPDVRVGVSDGAGDRAPGITLRIGVGSATGASPGSPVIRVSGDETADGRFVAAFGSPPVRREAYVIVSAATIESEHAAQSAAVRVLDGLCAVLSSGSGSVV